MNGKIVLGVLILSVVQLSSQAKNCYEGPPEIITKMTWPDMDTDCVKAVKDHIKKELEASLTYIAMGAHFLKSANFRPGVANFVLTHANEERQHAMALIDYILLRGYQISKDEIPNIKPLSTSWPSVFEALNTTLTIETEVRDRFKDIIKICEGDKGEEKKEVDYHISDFLTGVFLEEQHHGVRELSGMLTTLGRMQKASGSPALAEFEFDRTLLAGH